MNNKKKSSLTRVNKDHSKFGHDVLLHLEALNYGTTTIKSLQMNFHKLLVG